MKTQVLPPLLKVQVRDAHRTRTSWAGWFRTTVAIPVPFQHHLNHSERTVDGQPRPVQNRQSTSVTAIKTVRQECCCHCCCHVVYFKNLTCQQYLPFELWGKCCIEIISIFPTAQSQCGCKCPVCPSNFEPKSRWTHTGRPHSGTPLRSGLDPYFSL